MRKVAFVFFVLISLCFLNSCEDSNDDNSSATGDTQEKTDAGSSLTQDTTEVVETVKLTIAAGGGNATYSFIDDEGEVYKTGTLHKFEAITINHFKKGTYHIHFRYGGHVSASNVVSVTNDCKITIDNATNLNITYDSSSFNPSVTESGTVNVVVAAGGGNATYSFIDDEGEIYKDGTLHKFESININHFKKGTYHIHFRYGGHVSAYNILSITKDCKITIDDATNLNTSQN